MWWGVCTYTMRDNRHTHTYKYGLLKHISLLFMSVHNISNPDYGTINITSNQPPYFRRLQRLVFSGWVYSILILSEFSNRHLWRAFRCHGRRFFLKLKSYYYYIISLWTDPSLNEATQISGENYHFLRRFVEFALNSLSQQWIVYMNLK